MTGSTPVPRPPSVPPSPSSRSPSRNGRPLKRSFTPPPGMLVGAEALDAQLEQIKARRRAQQAVLEKEQEKLREEQNELRKKEERHKGRKEKSADIKLQTFGASYMSGNNRLSAKNALRTLSSQLRANLKRNAKTVAGLRADIKEIELHGKGTPAQNEHAIEDLEEEILNYPVTVAQMYASLDTDGNGYLDRDEFLVGLINLKIDLNIEELGLMWTLFDVTGDGRLDYWEFEPIIRRDDARNAKEPTGKMSTFDGRGDVRKGSQLALRRPSMLRALQEHTKSVRTRRIKQSSKQMTQKQVKAMRGKKRRKHSKQPADLTEISLGVQKTQFQTTAVNPRIKLQPMARKNAYGARGSANPKNFVSGKPLSHKWVIRPAAQIHPMANNAQNFLSPRARKLVSKRSRFLRGELFPTH